MADILPFRPRPRPAASAARLAPQRQIVLREDIEDAAHAALDAADKLIAILDAMDGDADLEDGGDAEPSLGAPEGHSSQVVWLRGGDRHAPKASRVLREPPPAIPPKGWPSASVGASSRPAFLASAGADAQVSLLPNTEVVLHATLLGEGQDADERPL